MSWNPALKSVRKLVASFGPETRSAANVITRETRAELCAVRLAYGSDVFVSLGSRCYTSFLLKSWGLKSASMPFDWIFSSNLMVKHCIEDDFKTFMDPQFFSPVPRDRRISAGSSKCDHLYYRDNFGLLTMFNHRDPTTSRDLDYYQRCVARFTDLYTSPDRIVFVSIFWKTAKFVEEFLDLQQALQERSKGCRLVGLAVSEANGVSPTYDTVMEEQGSVLVQIDLKSRWLEFSFGSVVDDIFVHTALCQALLKAR